MDSWERFEETQLPSQAQFYILLNDKHITQGTIQTSKESVGNFRAGDPGRLPRSLSENGQAGSSTLLYIAGPDLGYNAQKTDVDMHLFIEQGTHGGISTVSKQYAKANNPCVKDYNPNNPNNNIQYLDANNHYSCVMCKPLPKGKFA